MIPFGPTRLRLIAQSSTKITAVLGVRSAPMLQTSVDKLVWLPVKHRKGFWTVLLDPQTQSPVYWLPLDPY